MKPDTRFLDQPKHFWANVRSISQHVGYTVRGTGRIGAPDPPVMAEALHELGLGTAHVMDRSGKPTAAGDSLAVYFAYRAEVLHSFVEPRLMDAKKAARAFERVRKATKSKLPVPMNKQKGDKKRPAYFTAIVNMLIDANIGRLPCDYDPRGLTTFTRLGVPLRTLVPFPVHGFRAVTIVDAVVCSRRTLGSTNGMYASPDCRAIPTRETPVGRQSGSPNRRFAEQSALAEVHNLCSRRPLRCAKPFWWKRH